MRVIIKEVTYSNLDLNSSYSEVNEVINEMNLELGLHNDRQYKVLLAIDGSMFYMSMLDNVTRGTKIVKLVQKYTGSELIFVIGR